MQAAFSNCDVRQPVFGGRVVPQPSSSSTGRPSGHHSVLVPTSPMTASIFGTLSCQHSPPLCLSCPPTKHLFCIIFFYRAKALIAVLQSSACRLALAAPRLAESRRHYCYRSLASPRHRPPAATPPSAKTPCCHQCLLLPHDQSPHHRQSICLLCAISITMAPINTPSSTGGRMSPRQTPESSWQRTTHTMNWTFR